MPGDLQMVKLHFKLGNSKEMMASYRQMLTYVKSAVTRNYSEKASCLAYELQHAHAQPLPQRCAGPAGHACSHAAAAMR